MKRSIFSRIGAALFLYLGIFIILVIIQFKNQRAFARYIGSMLISGSYAESPVLDAYSDGGDSAGGYSLKGEVTLSFGGLEFRLQENGKFALLRNGGEKDLLLPQTMNIAGDSAIFDFKDKTRLVFNVISGDGDAGPELRINGQFGEEYAGLELPYRILRASRIRDMGDGHFVILNSGTSYSFGLSRVDGSRGVVILDAQDPTANYRAVPKQESFIPDNFILSTAKDTAAYAGTLSQWRDKAYAFWSGAVLDNDDETLITAYIGESVGRGIYKEALAGLPPAFLRRAAWTYNASVYLGRLDIGLRSLSSFERDAFTRLSALVAAKSEDFFLEPHVIEFCGIRAYGQFLDSAAELALSLYPDSLSPGILPGILEAYIEWNAYRSRSGNPFEDIAEGACIIISGGIKQIDGGGVLYFLDGKADTKYNLRLGLALDRYGRFLGREDWGSLGRSIVVSVLALSENDSLPAELIISVTEKRRGTPEASDIVNVSPGSELIDLHTLYRLIPAAAYPHAASIGAPADGIWAWTASDSVTVSTENNIMDIAVSFPAGQTHYMLIRGLRSFSKIQLYGIDYRTDPQFERYDSSGWSFSPSEQTLLLKLKHRSSIEHITLFY
ncbi:MAG: hypothetical protein LBU18_02110 [Treponema sp.]|jgi:hypothetical protein|nr:hypothetical protein [Treponema sp.]